MKQKIYYLIALCLAVSTVASAQTEEPEEVTTLDMALSTAPQYTVFNRLVTACGLQAELSKNLDEAYKEAYLTVQIRDLPQHPTEQVGTIPAYRRYGYTIFAETDAVWEALLGKAAANITVADVKQYIIARGIYPNGTQDDNYTDEKNVVNLFTTYHILPERLSPDKLVIHYNELGYNFKTSTQYTIPVEEFYCTLGQPRLLKIYESLESNGVYLNRFPVLRNGRGQFSAENAGDDATRNDYHESGTFHPVAGNAFTADENQGILVYDKEGNQPSVSANGYIYPLSQLLAYTENVQNQLGAQRLRFDFAALLPEMMNNDLRRPMETYSYGSSHTRGIPVSREYQYFENLDIADGTQVYYLSGYEKNWANYQGDEFNIIGNYEFTLKLPPVPTTGTYELRIGYSAGSSLRSITQFSVGTDKEHFTATELPIDLRIGGKYKRTRYYNMASFIGWAADTGNETNDRFVDLRLYEQGIMKGPQCTTYGYGSQPLRTEDFSLRRIVWRGNVEAGKTYYLHVKNCMESDQMQFHMDYMEWCPKNVYANPETPEDIW